jgi:hypothetical protein
MFGLRIKQLAKTEWLSNIQLYDQKKGITRLDKLDSTVKIPRGTSRLLASTFYQLKLGHGYNRAYLSRIGKVDFSDCSCGQIETAKHLVFDCIDTSLERATLKKALKGQQLTEKLVFQTRPGIEQLLSFIASTRIGTRRWHLERVERENTSLDTSRLGSEAGASEASIEA